MTGAAGGSGGAADGTAGAGGAAAPAWHQGQVESETVGFWQNKGLDPNDAGKLAIGLTKMYRDVEKLVGVRPDELVRFPKDANDPAYNGIHERLGVPKEAKDYGDFKEFKFSDGSEIDQAFSDLLRGALHTARVPKDRANTFVKALVDDMNKRDAADASELSAKVAEENELLKKNWGAHYGYNLGLAQIALETLGQKAGINLQQAQAAFDSLTKGANGIGHSLVLEMLRNVGAMIKEPGALVTGGQGGPGMPMTAAAARAEIAELKLDTEFNRRLTAGGQEEKRRMDRLFKIGYGTGVAA